LIDYILTPEEENKAINFAIESAKKHLTWKLSDLGCKEEQILAKISEIDWLTRIDKEAILANANENKHQILFHKEQRLKDEQLKIDAENELRKEWTANKVYNFIKKSCIESGKEFLKLENQTTFIEAICYFISEDERFETKLGLSLKKGLLIRGTTGLGKTDLIKWVSTNQFKPIKIVSTIEINEQLKSDGEFTIGDLDSFKILYLDDVGTEEETVNYYGTKISFFKNFIESYYLKNRNFNKLIVSTNLSMQQIEDKYGIRVRSRLSEIFNKINVSGSDLRG
jgi:hypothetical protein